MAAEGVTKSISASSTSRHCDDWEKDLVKTMLKRSSSFHTNKIIIRRDLTYMQEKHWLLEGERGSRNTRSARNECRCGVDQISGSFIHAKFKLQS